VDRRCLSKVLKSRADAGRTAPPAAWRAVRLQPLPLPAGSGDRSGAGSRSLEQTATERLEAERTALGAERVRLEQAALLLESCANGLTAARADFLQGAERELVELALKIATQVIHDEVTQRPEVIISQAQTALAKIKEEGVITIRVHPLMLEVLRNASPRLLDGLGPATRLHFEPDPAISPGGCMVETQHKIVDARLNSQAARIGTALIEDLNHTT
jgi:flagellar assembly protein FliH